MAQRALNGYIIDVSIRPIDTHVPGEENRPITSRRGEFHTRKGGKTMNQLIWALLVIAAVLYLLSGVSRFFKFQIAGHDPTIWWRGSMGLLGFSIALLLWQLLRTHPAR